MIAVNFTAPQQQGPQQPEILTSDQADLDNRANRPEVKDLKKKLISLSLSNLRLLRTDNQFKITRNPGFEEDTYDVEKLRQSVEFLFLISPNKTFLKNLLENSKSFRYFHQHKTFICMICIIDILRNICSI